MSKRKFNIGDGLHHAKSIGDCAVIGVREWTNEQPHYFLRDMFGRRVASPIPEDELTLVKAESPAPPKKPKRAADPLALAHARIKHADLLVRLYQLKLQAYSDAVRERANRFGAAVEEKPAAPEPETMEIEDKASRVMDHTARFFMPEPEGIAPSNVAIEAAYLILSRDEQGQKDYKKSMDRDDLTLDEWINHSVTEKADDICYMIRIRQKVEALVRKAFLIGTEDESGLDDRREAEDKCVAKLLGFKP